MRIFLGLFLVWVGSANLSFAATNVGIRKIVVGFSHSCAIDVEGGLWCWGLNANGQLGHGDVKTRLIPVRVKALSGIKIRSVALGVGHTCAVSENDELYCWGNNLAFETGQPKSGSYSVPMLVPAFADKPIREIYSKQSATCAILKSGSLWCWGNNNDAQVGSGSLVPELPLEVPYLRKKKILDVVMGTQSICAVVEKEKFLWCWGFNRFGETGQSSQQTVLVPKISSIPFDPKSESLLGGANHFCKLGLDKNLSCWGNNNTAQQGTVKFTMRFNLGSLPAVYQQQFEQLNLGYFFSCGKNEKGWLYCWGYSNEGSLGLGESEEKVFDSPQLVYSGSLPILEVVSRVESSCAIFVNGLVRCWGGNVYGQLGYGNTDTIGNDPGERIDLLPFLEFLESAE